MSYSMSEQDKEMLYSFFNYYFYFNDVNETTKLKSKHTLATEIVDFFVSIRGYDRESLIVLVENEIPGYFLYTSGEPNYFDELKKNEPVMPAIPATAFQGMIKRDTSLGSLTASKWLRQAQQGYRQIDKNKKQIVVPTIQDYLVNRLVTPGRAAAAALLPSERRNELGQMIKAQVFDKKKTLPPRIDDLFKPPETLVPIQRFEHMEKELYMAIRLQKDCLACLRLSGFLNKKNTPNISFNLKLHYNDDDTDLLIQLRWERTSIFGDTTTRDPVSTNRWITDWARAWKKRFPSRGTGNPGTLPGFNPYNNRREDSKDWHGESSPSSDVLVDFNTQLDRQKFKTPTKYFEYLNEPPSVLPSDKRDIWVSRRETTHSPGGLFKKPQRVVCSKFEPFCLDGDSHLSLSTSLKRLSGQKKLWDDKPLSSRSEDFTWEDAGAAFHTSVGVTDVETSKKFEIFCFSNNKKSIRDTKRRVPYEDDVVYDGFVLIGPPASYYEFQMANPYENIKDYVVYMCLFILKLCQIIPPQIGDMNTKIETIRHNAVRLLQTYIPEREWPDLLATMTFETPTFDGGGTKKNKSKKKKIKKNKSKKTNKKK